ncbi:MAG: SAM-dependent methyltransferase [Bacteroidales bacterium]|nr:SAM-dependent methyltransferase [Bacteroidales bacterium]
MTNQDTHIKCQKLEYGDWQTNYNLAVDVCRLLKDEGFNPQVIIEPTCGIGNFILAALDVFDGIECIYGIEINKAYLNTLSVELKLREINNVKIELIADNIFNFDLKCIRSQIKGKQILVLGNPPWVTNSKLGRIDGKNLPNKTNYKHLKGIDAITGRGGFDIAEAVCRKFISGLHDENLTLALLLKNSVIRNIVYEQCSSHNCNVSLMQYNIDAKKEFGATVDASLMLAKINTLVSPQCQVIDFYTKTELYKYGWINNKFVSNVSEYNGDLDGCCQLQWWSGIKHDCAKVMELTKKDGIYFNGFGDVVDIEDSIVYPLLKSSDVDGKEITSTTRYVIIPQHNTSQDTEQLKYSYPKAYQYLLQHADKLDARKSIIYEKRPRFSIFGIGDYSFKRYKVIISGLYKHAKFSFVGLIEGKPVMLDDTCYMIGFDDVGDAIAVFRTLNDEKVRRFLHSLMFLDAKRVINKELLMRIDLDNALNIVCKKYNLNKPQLMSPQQLSLF